MTREPDQMASRRKMRISSAWIVALPLLVVLGACNTVGPQSGNSVVDGTVHVCSSCHGLDGRSISPTFPRLAGQQHDYIVAQLTAFRDHTRADPHAHTYMWGMAAKLTDSTIDGVATSSPCQAGGGACIHGVVDRTDQGSLLVPDGSQIDFTDAGGAE